MTFLELRLDLSFSTLRAGFKCNEALVRGPSYLYSSSTRGFNGGDDGNRTHDPLLAKQAHNNASYLVDAGLPGEMPPCRRTQRCRSAPLFTAATGTRMAHHPSPQSTTRSQIDTRDRDSPLVSATTQSPEQRRRCVPHAGSQRSTRGYVRQGAPLGNPRGICPVDVLIGISTASGPMSPRQSYPPQGWIARRRRRETDST